MHFPCIPDKISANYSDASKPRLTPRYEFYISNLRKVKYSSLTGSMTAFLNTRNAKVVNSYSKV